MPPILPYMIFLVFGEKLGAFIFNIVGLDQYIMHIWNLCRYIIGIVTVIIVIMNLYKFTPNKKLTFKEVLPGAIVSTLLKIKAPNFSQILKISLK